MTSHWDKLPTEIQDLIFLHLWDIDTVLLNERYHVLEMMKKNKRVARLFNWTNAAKFGSVELLKYLFRVGCVVTHSAGLVELALTYKHLDAADYIWQHRTEISNRLWKKKRQRQYNRQVSRDSLERLISLCNEKPGDDDIHDLDQRFAAAHWFLQNTKQCFTLYAVIKANSRYRHAKEGTLARRQWLILLGKMFERPSRLYYAYPSDTWIDAMIANLKREIEVNNCKTNQTKKSSVTRQ